MFPIPAPEQQLLGIVVLAVFIPAFLLELLSGRIHRGERPLRDAGLTLAGIAAHAVFSSPVVGTLSGIIVLMFFQDSAGAMAGTNFWLAFAVIFVVQEFLHYWMHRFAHEWRWFWKLHRTHHTAETLNVGVLYRYNVFWVLLLPQSWFGPLAIYLGLGEPYVAAVLVTYIVNTLTHTTFRWDLWLREKMPWSEPFWRVIEHVITLPDTHHAHHAFGKGSHPNGNYAITLFIFDTLFGTAKIPNTRQKRFGLPIGKRLHWAEELFWPVIKKPLMPLAKKNAS
ncbi:sterol desaturase family protein [Endozoicomonas sp.]|uniref:sterol desaturase family protein n=1 Tax=Endozoicomonas sp. TaxID=1892382 RepID=UPI003AF5C65A